MESATPAPGRPRRVLIWTFAVAIILVFGLSTVLAPDAALWGIVFGLGIGSLTVVGALLADRSPATRIGLLLMASAALLAGGAALSSYARSGAVATPEPWPGYLAAGQVGDPLWVAAIAIVLIGIPLIFPTGHLLSPRWRWVVGLVAIGVTVVMLSQSVMSPTSTNDESLANPLYLPWLATILDPLAPITSATLPLAFVAALLALFIRYRRGSMVERQQLKWLLATAAFAAIVFPFALLMPAGPLADIAFLIGLLALFALPLSIGIAVMRYRLYEIDRLISRTIAYAAISLVLIGVYIVVVLLLQTVLGQVVGSSTLAVAVSTLVVASLFQPVRRRIQTAVDRRFHRQRYDADRTVEAFAERLRGQVDLEPLVAGLDATIQTTVAPAGTSIWIRPRITGRSST
jgi:hypothetical protein